MKAIFEKPIRSYALGVLFLTLLVGGFLFQAGAVWYWLIPVLAIQLTINIIILLHIADRFIAPLDKAIHTVDKLVKGNYRARIHQPATGKMNVLSNKVNALARNLSELSIHEQMQKEQLSTIVNNIESGLVLIDEKGYIHYVNRKFIDMFGKAPKAYHGYLYYDVLEHEEIHQLVQETFLHEKNIKKLIIRKQRLKENFLEIVGVPIFNERKQLKGAVLVLYDITELKKLEMMRKDFVANVSHELKTPMTSIKGFAETLLDGAMEDPDARKEFIGIIFDESNRLQYLIDDLLTLSQLENEGFQIQTATSDITHLVAEIEPLIRHKAEKKGIRFASEIEPNLAAVLDRERIKQVMINLLDNAISYTQERGHVKLIIKQVRDALVIEVEDTGIGIEAEAIPRLFERFYRVDKARSRNTGGTGLGLAIVKHIVELHQGEIEIDSEPGKGSTFSVTLPDLEEAHKRSML